uniref:Uncharacterized protein n=1 Tax=Sinocyclocheilus anshuiensis TaxID=1608454 RepID=A0A671LG74_9TELE
MKATLACHTGSQVECEKAPFVPGYNLAGEGFDVVRMRRKGAFLINVKSHMDNGTCTVCKNRFQGGQIQKLPSAVLDWRPFSRCSKQLSSALHHSVDSLMKSSTLDDIGKAIFGGSRSDIAKFAQSQNAMDKATFALHELSSLIRWCVSMCRPTTPLFIHPHRQAEPKHNQNKVIPQDAWFSYPLEGAKLH